MFNDRGGSPLKAQNSVRVEWKMRKHFDHASHRRKTIAQDREAQQFFKEKLAFPKAARVDSIRIREGQTTSPTDAQDLEDADFHTAPSIGPHECVGSANFGPGYGKDAPKKTLEEKREARDRLVGKVHTLEGVAATPSADDVEQEKNRIENLAARSRERRLSLTSLNAGVKSLTIPTVDKNRLFPLLRPKVMPMPAIVTTTVSPTAGGALVASTSVAPTPRGSGALSSFLATGTSNADDGGSSTVPAAAAAAGCAAAGAPLSFRSDQSPSRQPGSPSSTAGPAAGGKGGRMKRTNSIRGASSIVFSEELDADFDGDFLLSDSDRSPTQKGGGGSVFSRSGVVPVSTSNNVSSRQQGSSGGGGGGGGGGVVLPPINLLAAALSPSRAGGAASSLSNMPLIPPTPTPRQSLQEMFDSARQSLKDKPVAHVHVQQQLPHFERPVLHGGAPPTGSRLGSRRGSMNLNFDSSSQQSRDPHPTAALDVTSFGIPTTPSGTPAGAALGKVSSGGTISNDASVTFGSLRTARQQALAARNTVAAAAAGAAVGNPLISASAPPAAEGSKRAISGLLKLTISPQSAVA